MMCHLDVFGGGLHQGDAVGCETCKSSRELARLERAAEVNRMRDGAERVRLKLAGKWNWTQ